MDLKKIYYYFEDKWYSFLDKVDEKIPVYDIVDKIDDIFPSFLLFLIIVFWIILFLMIGFFITWSPTYYVEITVLTSNGIPILGANVEVLFEDEELFFETNELGKVFFETTEKTLVVNISKKNFLPISEIIDSEEKNVFKLQSISAANFEEPDFLHTVIINDAGNNLIPTATLNVVCDGTIIESFSEQNEEGFSFKMPPCDIIQLRATAFNFEEKTITLNKFDQRTIITLNKIVEQATVFFKVKNDSGESLNNANIIVRNEFGVTIKNLFTNNFGEIETTLNLGRYSFVATYFGKRSVDDFELNSKNLKEIEIIIVGADIIEEGSTNIRDLSFEIVNNSLEPIVNADLIIFRDGEKYAERKTNQLGKISPIRTTSTDPSEYFVFVNAVGYETRFASVEIQESGSVQRIVLRNASTFLKINLIDDAGLKLSNALVTINVSNLKDPLISITTDTNGSAIINNLAPGNYIIFGIDRQERAEASENIYLGQDASLEKTLVLLTGRGRTRFNVVEVIDNRENSVLPNTNFFVNTGTGFFKNDLLVKRTNFFETNEMVVGTKHRITIEDQNFFKKQSFDYEILRGSNTKTVFLKKESSLPNQNSLQLFLDQVYNSNPINSRESTTTRFNPNNDYYLLFDFVINVEDEGNAIIDFSTNNENVFLEDIITINDYARLLVGETVEQIDWTNEELFVDEKAKNGRLLLKNVVGKKAIPILLKINVDENAIGFFEINFSARLNENNSLNYKREFEIGRTFCTTNCPTIAFDNFVIRNNIEKPIEDNKITDIFIGDSYEIKTVVTNLSDTAFGKVFLENFFEENYLETISFANNELVSRKELILGPIASANIFSKIFLKDKFGLVQLKQNLLKENNELLTQRDSTNVVRLRVRTKEEILIDVQPDIVEPGILYPLFLIRTRFKTGLKTSADWEIKKLVGEERINIGQGYSGTTDEEGLSFISFDTRSLVDGDKIIITAVNEESIISERIIELKNLFRTSEIEDEQNCIELQTNFENNNIILEVGETNTFTLKETCGENKKINLNSDLLLSELDFTINANSTKNIVVTATPRDNLLGVYPIRVFDKDLLKEIGVVDITIKNSAYSFSQKNCFELEKTIFNLKDSILDSSTIRNHCFSGRKDNFYPKLDVSTNTVSTEYRKPGNPQEINLNIKVIGSALELIIYAFGNNSYIHQFNRGPGCGSSGSAEPANRLFFGHVGADLFGMFVEDILGIEVGERPVTEFDLERPIPSTVWTPSRIQTLGEKTLTQLEKISFSTWEDCDEDDEDCDEYYCDEEDCDEYYCDDDDEDCGEEDFDEIEETIETSDDYEILHYREDIIRSPTEIDVGSVSGTFRRFFPGSLGTPTTPSSGCQKLYSFPVRDPKPPNYVDANWLLDGWKGFIQNSWGGIAFTTGGHCNPCKVDFFSLIGSEEVEGGKVEGQLYTRGRKIKKRNRWYNWVAGVITLGWALRGHKPGTGFIDLQQEFYRTVAFGIERQNIWSREQKIEPIEGRIFDLGSYLEATPIPDWTNEKQLFGKNVGAQWTSGNMGEILLGVLPLGFVPREVSEIMVSEMNYSYWNSANPLVESDMSGILHYKILSESIDPEVNAFLRNGRLYAEYIGTPEIASPNIDFNIIRNNLLGREYAILRVADWISGEEKSMQGFQIKLTGPENYCISETGVEGVTGRDFAPRLNFNWDWQNIPKNACDTTNIDYFYCDATQFNISLFKKLFEIDEILKQNAFHLLPQKTIFYSNLIRDNYSKDFLKDFEYYYSNEFLGADPFFNEKFNRLIKQEMLEIIVDDPNSETKLPFGGIYRVEIEIEEFDLGLNSLFDSNKDPIKKIFVKLVPIQRAPNYNLFFETPLNGLVGKRGDSFERKDYGVSFEGETIRINPNVVTQPFEGNIQKIITQKKTNIKQLNNGIVLNYTKNDSGNFLTLIPSQPNPVIMLVDNKDRNNLSINYSLVNTNENLTKKWFLVGSTIGNRKCFDLSNNDKQTIVENIPGRLTWNNALIGRNWLGTTFFTPKNLTPPLQLQPNSPQIEFYSKLPLNQKNVMLEYYDVLGIEDYDTIQGIFNRINNQEMCISVGNEETVEIWWNPQYLRKLIDDIHPAKNRACN